MKRIVIIPFFLLLFFFSFSQDSRSADYKLLGKEINTSFEKFAPTGLSVAVVKDGEVVYKSAFGFKNADKKERLETASLFSIASCSKAFTAAGIALLVEEGKLGWDDKVTDYIPAFRLGDPYISANMTVRDLLCHRSGLGTFYGDLLWYNTDYTNEEILRRMRYLPLTTEFRSEFGYQNNMFMVAGLIIEKLSGMSWEKYVQTKFFDPLGMKNTRPSNDELPSGANIAMGHVDGKAIEVYDFNGTKAAASIYSSVEELSNWVKMFLAGGQWEGKQILSESSIYTMHSPHTIIKNNKVAEKFGIHFKSYGLGWSLFDYGGRKVIEHNGGMPGYISKVCLVPEENLGIIILNNGNDFLVNDVVRYKTIDLFLGKEGNDWDATYWQFKTGGDAYTKAEEEKRAAARVMGTKPDLELGAYAGTYEDQMYGTASVSTSASGALHLTLDPAKKVFTGELEHWHYNTFKVQFKDPYLTYGLVTFELDEKAQVKGFKIDLPSGDFHFFNLDFRKKK